MKIEEIKDPRTRSRIEKALREAEAFKRELANGIPMKQAIEQSFSVMKPSNRIKQKSTDGMNKLEREALALLRSEYPQSKIEPHTMKLQLANGCWFYPDFTVFHGCPPIALYEIKGPHFWEDAIVKLKVAARQWPGFSWWLMWKEKGQWQRQRILP